LVSILYLPLTDSLSLLNMVKKRRGVVIAVCSVLYCHCCFAFTNKGVGRCETKFIAIEINPRRAGMLFADPKKLSQRTPTYGILKNSSTINPTESESYTTEKCRPQAWKNSQNSSASQHCCCKQKPTYSGKTRWH